MAPGSPTFSSICAARSAFHCLRRLGGQAHLVLDVRRARMFGGRVAASLVSAMGVPELIANGLKDYRECALRLACNSQLLASLKAKLCNSSQTCPIF